MGFLDTINDACKSINRTVDNLNDAPWSERRKRRLQDEPPKKKRSKRRYRPAEYQEEDDDPVVKDSGPTDEDLMGVACVAAALARGLRS